MAAKMTPELRSLMKKRPIIERIRLWWLLRKLSVLDEAYHDSFVEDAGYAVSNCITGGRLKRLLHEIEKVEHKISLITVPILRGQNTRS